MLKTRKLLGLGKTAADLAGFRRQWDGLLATAASARARPAAPQAPTRLVETFGFGSNPGNLRMHAYVPAKLTEAPALVVVLHGCTQDAAGYDHGAGWSTLADRYGFAVLVPEQQRTNNPKNCFTWFQEGDIERGGGEPFSIVQMVERMIVDHGIDRRRVFVTGLSAGGAMTSVMLATYPDVFAGGAIIAGLPYRAATNVQEAFESMFQGKSRPASEWGDLVRSASPHRGSWPKVSIWHGGADTTVKPINAGEILKQWTDVHGLPMRPSLEQKVDGHPRRVWRDAAGQEVIEEYAIAGMAHGTPLAVGEGADHYGAAGPFLLDVGISSSYHIAKFWGLTAHRIEAAANDDAPRPIPEPSPPAEGIETARAEPPPGRLAEPEARTEAKPAELPKVIDVQAVIAKALKSAGLMK